MKKDSTELVFILDRSGSMSGLEKDTVGGFNSMLEKQRNQGGECRITTVLFDNNYELLHDRVDIQAVMPITQADYCVGGSTALLDAIGRSIDKIASVQKSVAEEYRAEKVLFVIITDGEENSSRRYSSAKVKSLIKTMQDRYGWEFIFLGANIDAVETGDRLGIKRGNSVNYVADADGTALGFESCAELAMCYRETGVIKTEILKTVEKDHKRRGGR